MIRKCRNPVLIDPQNESRGEKPCGTQIEDDAIGCDECLPPLTVAEKGAMPDTNPMAYSLPTGGLVGKYTRTNVSTLACLDLTDAWMLNRRKLLPEGVALDKLERVATIGIERAKSFVAEFSIREDEESFLLVADIDRDAEALGRKGDYCEVRVKGRGENSRLRSGVRLNRSARHRLRLTRAPAVALEF